ncbi:MAG: tetratricopeptide repeat protein, partial [Planctomycetes bacterium]|nr:tetratricopeptide repeat protein [Planctomycetota bacterium]
TRERARAWLAEHPDDLDARITLAGSLARLKDWGSAYAEARAVLRARPDDLLALEILAVSAYGKQDVAAAREYCERGLALDSSRPRLWQIKSVIEAFHGDHEGALLASRRALELEPNDPEALANYGLAISMQGDDEGALRYYDQALAIEDSADTRFNRAVSYMRLERFRECLADAEVVRRELPGESSGYCLRASALANLDPPAALEAVAQLEADFPADARAAHTRGEVYRRLGTPDQAREAYRLCIELDPEGVYARLARKALRKLESRR